MKETVDIGAKLRRSRVVTAGLAASSFGEGLMPVLATPYLVAFMEEVASDCIAPAIEEDQITLGTMIDVRHLAATPIGKTVTCEAVLTGIEGRRYLFAMRAWDDAGIVAEGTQERFLVHRVRFLERTRRRAESAAQPRAEAPESNP